MNILDQWLSHATFDQGQIDSERGVVTDEWRSRTQTVDGRLSEVAEDLYLAGTPYDGRDPIGTEESINSVPRDELVAFYDAWYRPDNAAVIVVGDIDVDDMVSQIEDRFGPATSRTDEMPTRPDTTFPVESEPGFALHHWNLAAALHQLGDRDACLAALRRFLATSTTRSGLAGDPDHPARVGLAHRMVSELERTARLARAPRRRKRRTRARVTAK